MDTEPAGEIVGKAYDPPFPYVTDFGPRSHTVLPADFVTTDDGTGIVHTALAFGEDDFALGERFGMTLQNPVLPNGTFDERIEPFAGRGVREAGPDIVEALRESGRLLRAEGYEHSYPHCWRCGSRSSTTPSRPGTWAPPSAATSCWPPTRLSPGTPITSSTGVSASGWRTTWTGPSRASATGARRCRSGAPTTARRRSLVGSADELRELGADVPDDLHRPYIDEATFERDGKTFRRVPELIDVWWDSGCMPFAHWGAHDAPVADYICEGLDQTRGWFYSMLAVSTLLFGRSSYETCLCLGLILDPEGQKMSKSKGNVVAPWDVLDTHGADAFRWYYFTSKQPWDGYRFSVDTVGESVRQFMLTLWNTYGFYVLYANVNDVDPQPQGLTDLDRWALSRLSAVTTIATERLTDYDTTTAGRALAAFVDELSNWYVRRSRRRFWEGDPAAFWTLHTCLVAVSKLLAPLIPFVTDEIYDNLDGSEPSVHLCDWPEPGERDVQLEWQMQVARDAVELGRSARAQAKIKVRQPARSPRR